MSNGRNILQEAVPLRGELLALWLPPLSLVGLVLAVGSLALGLVWRSIDIAPNPLVLCDGLSATIWGAGLVLYGPWFQLMRRESALNTLSQSTIWRSLAMLAMLGLSGLAIGLAMTGCLVAYDFRANYFLAKPIDVAPLGWSVSKLVVWQVANTATPWFLLSIASLTLFREIASRFGTLLWIWLGLWLHLPLLTGLRPGWSFLPSSISGLLAANLSNSEGMLRDHMLAPVHTWLTVLWVGAFTLAAVATLAKGKANATYSPLGCALVGGFSAGVLHSYMLGNRWAADPSILAPDSIAAISATVFTVTAIVWLLLASEHPVVSRLEMSRDWWMVLLPSWQVVFLSVPMIVAGRASHFEAFVSGCIFGIALFGLLTMACLLLRVRGPSLGSPNPGRQARTLLLFAPIILATCLRDGANRPIGLAMLAELQSAVFSKDQIFYAIQIAIVLCAIGLAGLLLPRFLRATGLVTKVKQASQI